MKKEIKAQELPEFIIEFIAEFINKKLSFSPLGNQKNSEKILHYGYISENFCLMLQEILIEEYKKPNPTPLTIDPLPNFIIELNNKIIYLYSKQFETNELDEISNYIDQFSTEFIVFLSNRKK